MPENRLHVTDIQQQLHTEAASDGTFHDVYHIHFRTPSGTRTKVKLPASNYSAQNAAELIAHEATKVEQVHDLENRELTAPPLAPPALEA